MVFDPSMYVLQHGHSPPLLLHFLIHTNYRSAAATSSAWIPLLYDTIIFGLTLYRTVPPIRREEASYILKRLLEDGLLYYRLVVYRPTLQKLTFSLTFLTISVIFSVTFVLTFMIVGAPPGTKNIAAQYVDLKVWSSQKY